MGTRAVVVAVRDCDLPWGDGSGGTGVGAMRPCQCGVPRMGWVPAAGRAWFAKRAAPSPPVGGSPAGSNDGGGRSPFVLEARRAIPARWGLRPPADSPLRGERRWGGFDFPQGERPPRPRMTLALGSCLRSNDEWGAGRRGLMVVEGPLRPSEAQGERISGSARAVGCGGCDGGRRRSPRLAPALGIPARAGRERNDGGVMWVCLPLWVPAQEAGGVVPQGDRDVRAPALGSCLRSEGTTMGARSRGRAVREPPLRPGWVRTRAGVMRELLVVRWGTRDRPYGLQVPSGGSEASTGSGRTDLGGARAVGCGGCDGGRRRPAPRPCWVPARAGTTMGGVVGCVGARGWVPTWGPALAGGRSGNRPYDRGVGARGRLVAVGPLRVSSGQASTGLGRRDWGSACATGWWRGWGRDGGWFWGAAMLLGSCLRWKSSGGRRRYGGFGRVGGGARRVGRCVVSGRLVVLTLWFWGC